MSDHRIQEAGQLPPPAYLRQWAALLEDTSNRFAPEATRLRAWAYRIEAREREDVP